MGILNILSSFAGAFGAYEKERTYNTTAVFTGVAVDKNNNIIDGSEGVPAFAYEVTYTDYTGKQVSAWHMFPNGEGPDPRKLAGKTMEIKYYESDTELFEVA